VFVFAMRLLLDQLFWGKHRMRVTFHVFWVLAVQKQHFEKLSPSKMFLFLNHWLRIQHFLHWRGPLRALVASKLC
jgi:hypothetical protein